MGIAAVRFGAKNSKEKNKVSEYMYMQKIFRFIGKHGAAEIHSLLYV